MPRAKKATEEEPEEITPEVVALEEEPEEVAVDIAVTDKPKSEPSEESVAEVLGVSDGEVRTDDAPTTEVSRDERDDAEPAKEPPAQEISPRRLTAAELRPTTGAGTVWTS